MCNLLKLYYKLTFEFLFRFFSRSCYLPVILFHTIYYSLFYISSLSIYLLIFLPTFPLGITSRSLKMQEYGPISWLQTICPAGSQCFSHFSCLVYYIFPPAISIWMPFVTTCTQMVIILISTQFLFTSPYFFIFCPILTSCTLLTVPSTFKN